MNRWFLRLLPACFLLVAMPLGFAQDLAFDDEFETEELNLLVIEPPDPPASSEVSEDSPLPPDARIEATVEQLEELINAPPGARLGREVDEQPDQPFMLFSDKQRIEELLGDNPRYVYIPSGTDPMIVPWIRNRVMAAELYNEARDLMGSGKYDEAMAKLDMLLERFGDSDSAERARGMKAQIDRIHRSQQEPVTRAQATPGPTPRLLPLWIPENTRGIIFDVDDPSRSSVLIGEHILRAGQSIPSFPGIRVVEVDRSSVTLDYQGEVFKLQVEGRN